MSDERGLLKAIVANPEDDTPRLVYADWLQEHNRAEEAEFIRVQCALKSSSPDHPDYVEWQSREEELKLWLSVHQPGPMLTFPAGLKVDGGSDWWRWSRRGFPRFLAFDGNAYSGLKPMRELAKALERAFTQLPTRWMVVRFVTVEQLAELLKHPVAEQFERITVQLGVDERGGDEAAEVIARSRARNLRGASLAFGFGEAGATALAAPANFDRMNWFTLGGWTLTPGAIQALGGSAWFRALGHLGVRELSGASFEALCRLGPYPRLHTLELSGSLYPPSTWEGFARSKAFPALSALNLGEDEADLSAGRATPLFREPGLHLTHLDLSSCGIGNDAAEELARAPGIGSLRRLALAHNNLGPASFSALVGSRTLTELRHLDLSGNTPGLRGLIALAGNPTLRGLIALRLSGDVPVNRGLTPSRLHDFLSRLDMPNLRHLDLSGRPVGPKAASAIEKFPALTRLDLSNCELTNTAVTRLVQAPTLQNLIELNLADNGLDAGLAPLADSATLPRLSACKLSGNPISPALAKRLRKRPGMKL